MTNGILYFSYLSTNALIVYHLIFLKGYQLGLLKRALIAVSGPEETQIKGKFEV